MVVHKEIHPGTDDLVIPITVIISGPVVHLRTAKGVTLKVKMVNMNITNHDGFPKVNHFYVTGKEEDITAYVADGE